tara:strand:- start:4058 stop:4258 length:201 start_codon:yes stop_codon:yes gene_type:complete
MSTPYEKHSKLKHKVSSHSPNGYDIIIECEECPQRFLIHPGDKYPISMKVTPEYYKKWKSNSRSEI